MTRILKSVLAVGSVAALGFLPTSCQTGGIGDPCIPEDEYLETFSGFEVGQENIESRSFQCESRICLVNHFQGRVSCPRGQAARKACTDDSACDTTIGEACTLAGTFAPDCDDDEGCSVYGTACNKQGKFCECSETSCPEGFSCDPGTKQCQQKVCFRAGDCQDPNATDAENEGKGCCVPGDTTKPVAAAVCGQCDDAGGRSARRSVYCSCRCGVAEGQEADENFNFCDCPDDYVCAEVRPFAGLGDPQLAGKYCVKADDPIVEKGAASAALECGSVKGQFDSSCAGAAAIGQ